MPSLEINANVTFPIELQPIPTPFLTSTTNKVYRRSSCICAATGFTTYTAKAKDVRSFILFLARPESARRTKIDRGWFHVSQAHALVSENDEDADGLNGFSARILRLDF
jgi:hypothetical protein